jgi:chromosome segregation ATPase
VQAPTREQVSIREAKAAAKEAKVKSAKIKNDFINKHCNAHVSEEWKKVDDQKIVKLRGILNALQEENQNTQLLKKESENKAAKQELDATRSSVQVRLAAVKEKEELFKEREKKLQAHVEESEKSLHELETNIEKGEKKAKDEFVECKRLDREIESLQAEYKEHEAAKEEQLKKIALFSRYKKFLDMVMEQESPQQGYSEVEDLISRHNTLEAAHEELLQANRGLTSQLDRVRDECQRVQTRLQNEHLRISSQLHECQVNLDRHRAESQELEARLNRALEEKELKESKVGVIQMAIEQLFSRTLASMKLNPTKKNTRGAVDNKFQPVLGDKNDVKLDDMLRQIVERMEDLQEILQKADAEMRPKHAEQTLMVDEVEAKVQFMQSSDGHQGHRDHGVDSELLTAGSSQRRLHSDTSGASGGTSQAHLSKEVAQRGDHGHADALNE